MKRKIFPILAVVILIFSVATFSSCQPKPIDVETVTDVSVFWFTFDAFATTGSDLQYMNFQVTGKQDGKKVVLKRGDGEKTGYGLKVNGKAVLQDSYIFNEAGAYEITVYLNDFSDSFYLNVGNERDYHMYATRVYLKTKYRLGENLEDTDLLGFYVGIQEFGAHIASISIEKDYILETVHEEIELTKSGKIPVRLKYNGNTYQNVADYIYYIEVSEGEKV